MSGFHPIPSDYRFQDLTNRVFGRLTVIGYLGKHGHNKRWRCLCECGTATDVLGGHLKKGTIKSCGCYAREQTSRAMKKHGCCVIRGHSTKEYRAWQGMHTRCSSKKNPMFYRYGGRGISICERWRHSFENFLADMGKAPTKNHSIDRINNDGNYEPENCRWATAYEQCRNRKSNRFLIINGERKCIMDWAKVSCVKYATILARVKNGWNAEDAVFTPVN